MTRDEGIKASLTIAELAAKKPAFRKDGTVTGGNSSPLNDGAAGVLLMSEQAMTSAWCHAHSQVCRGDIGRGASGLHGDRPGTRDGQGIAASRLAGQ